VARFDTAEKENIARIRFVEFLPPHFELSEKPEPMKSIVRRVFHTPIKNFEDSHLLSSNAFSFLRQAAADQVEIEVLSHWIQRNPSKCPAVVGAAIISYALHITESGVEEKALLSLQSIIDETQIQINALTAKVQALLSAQAEEQALCKPGKGKSEKKLPTKGKNKKMSKSPKNNTKKYTPEDVVGSILYVLLHELKFTTTQWPNAHSYFCIDQVLAKRSGSVSVMNVIFYSIAQHFGLDCTMTLDQRCPLVRVRLGKRNHFCFVDFESKAILPLSKAMELHMKHLNSEKLSKAALFPSSDPKLMYCAIISNILMSNTSMELKRRNVFKAQLLYLANE
jgi:hypothetical protein